ncbi:TPA: DUF2589 domain-containing protein [Salmonella enterica]|nr:DUF2589 domain-containing protein [Salmonella enterica subsp. enterica serovar Miami]
MPDSQKEAWSQTTDSLRNDLEIPMDVIASQSQTLVKNWMTGFTQVMFDGVKYDKNGGVDFTKKLTPRMMHVSYEIMENGVPTQKNIEMPLIGAVQYPAVELDNINLKLNYEVNTSDETTNKSEASSETQSQVNVGFMRIGGSVKNKLSLSHNEDRKRKTDTRATLSLDANYTRMPQGEAISRIADVLMNSATSGGAGSSGSGDSAEE